MQQKHPRWRVLPVDLISFDDPLPDPLLHGAVYFAGSETTCANFRSSDDTVLFDSDRLDVRIPLSSRVSVGVGYVISGNLSLTANLAPS